MAYGNRGRQAGLFQPQQEDRAEGFLNFYLPTKSGGRSKVGFITLKGQSVAQRQFMDAIIATKGDEEKIAALLAKVMVEFNPAESTVELDL